MALGAMLVCVVTFIVFWPTVRNQFVAWDDQPTIVENEAFRGLTPAQLRWMFTTFHTGHWQPLSWITLAVNAEIAEAVYDNPIDPRPYHLTNNILHTLNALLFYFLALRLLQIGQRSEVRGQKSEIGARRAGAAIPHSPLVTRRSSLVFAAVVAALIFSVHPLRVESVAWATERRDVLSAFFFLGTLLAYVRAVAPSQPQTKGRSRLWFGLAIALAVLCLLSKSIGVVLPAVMLVLDVYPLRRLSLRTRELLSKATLSIIVEKVPFIVLAMIGSVIAVSAQKAAGAMFETGELGPGHRLYVMTHGFGFYVTRTVAPWNLSPLYEIPFNFSLRDGSFIASAAVVVFVTIVAWRLRGCFPAVLAAWCVYLICVLPVSGVFQSGPQLAADRYSYLSCMGFALLAGGAVQMLLSREASASKPSPSSMIAGVFAVATIVALSVLTWMQIGVWRDTLTLWSAVIERHPATSLAHMNRGNEYVRLNDLPRAQIDLEHAVQLWPNDARALSNLSHVLASRGDLANSEHYARQAVQIDPNSVDARLNLGYALLNLNRVDEAVEHYRAAFGLDAGNPRTLVVEMTLIQQLADHGRLAQALQLAHECANRNPESQQAGAQLQRLQAQSGDQ